MCVCVCVYFYMHPVGNELLPLSLSPFCPFLVCFYFIFFLEPPTPNMFVVDMHVYALR